MSSERVTAFKKLRAVPHSERVMGTNQDSEERMVIPEKLPLFIKRRKRQAPTAPVVPTTLAPIPTTGSTPALVPANPANSTNSTNLTNPNPMATNTSTGIIFKHLI